MNIIDKSSTVFDNYRVDRFYYNTVYRNQIKQLKNQKLKKKELIDLILKI